MASASRRSARLTGPAGMRCPSSGRRSCASTKAAGACTSLRRARTARPGGSSCSRRNRPRDLPTPTQPPSSLRTMLRSRIRSSAAGTGGGRRGSAAIRSTSPTRRTGCTRRSRRAGTGSSGTGGERCWSRGRGTGMLGGRGSPPSCPTDGLPTTAAPRKTRTGSSALGSWRRGMHPCRSRVTSRCCRCRTAATGSITSGRSRDRRTSSGPSSSMAELHERARRLGHEVFAPLADDSGRLNRPLVRALGEQGLLQLVFAGSSVAAFALSEPEAGSDVASLQLRAELDGDGYRLTGTKTWISNAPDADVYSVFARTSDEGAKGITAFVVPRDSDGLSGEAIELVAPHPVGRLDFDGVRVEPVQVLGQVGGGFTVAMETLDLFRPSVGAFAVGMAQAALDAAVAHTAARQAFGRPLSDFQAVSHQLAEMATRVQAARLLVRDAAAQYDAGVRPVRKASAMAKLYATEVAQQAVDVAIQVHGAAALQKGHLLEHLYREVRAPRIY